MPKKCKDKTIKELSELSSKLVTKFKQAKDKYEHLDTDDKKKIAAVLAGAAALLVGASAAHKHKKKKAAKKK